MQCAEQGESMELPTTLLSRASKCQYCGEAAVSSSLYIDPATGEKHYEFWCKACLEDLESFNKLPENEIPDIDIEDPVVLDEAFDRLSERERRKADYMRERIVVRNLNKGPGQ
jgi:hypothetical protein